MTDLNTILQSQRAYFDTGATLPIAFRARMLKRLFRAVHQNRAALTRALALDLGKSMSESRLSEIMLTLDEIAYQITHLPAFAAPKPTLPSPLLLPAIGMRKPSPFGNVLIVSPWNYPVLLTLVPLADAIAAGNTVIIKTSGKAPHVARMLRDILSQTFDEQYVAVLTGGREAHPDLLSHRYDMIFFTGSKEGGKQVLRAAAEHLTPTVLELGGKSPCIVDASADIKLAAKRIVCGKFLNCGQTCVAPDYVLCDRKIRPLLIGALVAELKRQYGARPMESGEYGKIVSRAHYDRLMNLIDESKIIVGGVGDPETCKIAPTLLSGVKWSDAIMQEEIFGPILPILTWDDREEVIPLLRSKPAPLALYLFTSDRSFMKQIVSRLSFGGGCINDTVMHLLSPSLPFGGVGESGMGRYHGRAGFEAFSYDKSLLHSSTHIDLPIRYLPGRANLDAILRLIFG